MCVCALGGREKVCVCVCMCVGGREKVCVCEDTYKAGGNDGSNCSYRNGLLCILQVPGAI